MNKGTFRIKKNNEEETSNEENSNYISRTKKESN